MREKKINNNDNVICILNRMSKVGNFQTTTIATTNSDYIRECMFIHTVKRSNSSETAAECRNIMNELLNFWFCKADFGCDNREETTIINAYKWTTSSLSFEETENPIGTELRTPSVRNWLMPPSKTAIDHFSSGKISEQIG